MNEVIISRLKQGISTFPKNIRSNLENFIIEYDNTKLADPSKFLTTLQSNFVSDSSRKYLFVDKSTIPSGGKGAFALCDIPPETEIGIYYGYDIAFQASPYAGRHEVANPTTNQIYEEFLNNPIIYINEPPIGKDQNCSFVIPSNQNNFLTVRTLLKKINRGDELFISYGPEYEYRNYIISEKLSNLYYSFGEESDNGNNVNGRYYLKTWKSSNYF